MMNRMLISTLSILFLLGGASGTDSPDAKALIDRRNKENAPVWADGDRATFFYRGPADKVDVLFGGDFKSLHRVGDSDVWTLSVDLPELQKAAFSYRFLPVRNGEPVKEQTGEMPIWRGPKAPTAAPEQARLKGNLQQVSIESEALGGPRRITVYLPPGHDPHKPCPIIYAADGESIRSFLRVLEPLIEAKRIPPIALIGVHSGGVPDYTNYDVKKDFRAQEYFPGIDPKRFAAHEKFFCAEVPAWARKQFGVSETRGDRFIAGSSNGGRFAVEMGLRHPDLFGHVFAFSVPGNGQFDLPKADRALPSFYLCAGTWEKRFHDCTAGLADRLNQRKVSVHFSSRVGGHDMAIWKDEFAAAVLWALAKK